MTCQSEDARRDQAAKIRDLNDKLRRELPHGRVMITRAVSQLPIQDLKQILELVRTFDTFTEGNDPWGEHDFGKIVFKDIEYFWKIDAYDLTMEFGSPDPADDSVSKRVLTLLLPEDY